MIRSIFIAIFVCSISVLRAQSSVEEVHINVVFNRTPLSKVFKVLHEKYDINFAYDNARVQNIIVTLTLNDLRVDQSLDRILKYTSLTFQKVGNTIVIVPRSQSGENLPEKTQITLSGIILDVETQETLPFAMISVQGTNLYTTTNKDGYFTLLNIPQDTCFLVIQYLGYLTQNVRVKDFDPSTPCSIQLKSDAKILNEVVVFDENNQAVQVANQPGTFVFNPKSLSTLPSLGEQDISRTLQLISGVTATDESSSGMTIRGSHPSHNLTLLDGMTLYQQDHFFGSFSIINADIIKDVHVSKGIFDARYGGRTSGVIDITSKNGNAVRPSFNVKLNSINIKGTAELPLGKKWSLFVGARRSFTDVFKSGLYNSLFDIASTSNDQLDLFSTFSYAEGPAPHYHFFDANTKLSFRPSDRDVLSLSSYISRDRMQVKNNFFEDIFLLKQNEVTRWGNNGLSFRWGRQWNSRYYSTVRVSYSNFFRMYDLFFRIDVLGAGVQYLLDLDNRINDVTYAADNEWKLNDKLSFNWGLQSTRQQTRMRLLYDYTNSGYPPEEIPEEEDIPEDSVHKDFSWQHAFYGSIVMSPINKLTLTAGARFVYYYNDKGQLFFEPRLTTQYKATEQLNLKAGYARNNQFISQLIYYSENGSLSGITENFWRLSVPANSDYPVISSDHFSAGAILRHKQFVFDAEAFYKVSRGNSINEDINSGMTNAYGLDIMIQKVTGVHRGWIAYSLSHATQKHPDINSGDDAPSWQDQRHELKVANMLILGDWNLSSTLIFGSGKPYPKYTVKYYRDENGLITDYDFLLDYSNQSRLPAYFRIDLAASYTMRFKKAGEMLIGLSIHNITNHKNIKTRKINEESVSFDEEIPVTYNDITLLGFTPTLSISISF